MKKRKFILPLLLLALSSCAGKQRRPDESFFSLQDDPELSYVTRNGDNYGRKGVGYSYTEVSREATLSSLQNEIDGGKSVFLFLHGDTCPHCAAVHDDYVSAFLDSGLEVYSVEFKMSTPAEQVQMLDELASLYPAYAKYLNGSYSTPSAYLLDGPEKIRIVGMENNHESLQNLEQFLKDLLNFTYVYTFRSFDSFLAFSKENDCLAFMGDMGDSFLSEEIYPLAKHSLRHTAALQWEFFSQADLQKARDYFQGHNLAKTEQGQPTKLLTVKESPAEARQFVQEYYR